MNRSANSTGFTLIEVLLALLILTIVSATIYASFSTTGENVDRAEAVRDETDLARTLISRLSDDIGNVYCKPGMKAALFYGVREEVEGREGARRIDRIFMSTRTNWRRPDTKESELWIVGYRFRERPDGSGYDMVRYERRDLTTTEPPLEGGAELVITEQVDQFRVRYWDGSTWKEEWGSEGSCSLPRAVEVLLVTDTGKRFLSVTEVRNTL